MSTRDTWSPEQYERFRDERSQPFFDLLALVRPRPGLRAIDLGCGTGELTRVLHDRLACAETLGLDSSAAMLAKSAAHAGNGLRFEQGDLAAGREGAWDLVFSNAAIQWVDDHPAVFARLAGMLAPDGQLAVQMPANHDHPSHLVAAELADREPFRGALGGYVRHSPVLLPERYAELLHTLGLRDQHVRLQVYGHELASADGVVEWVKGTLLTDYEKRLPPAIWAEFLQQYRALLLSRLGDARPYFYAFKRLLITARKR